MQFQIFIGYEKTAELKMYFHTSLHWKRDEELNALPLIEIEKLDRIYIGLILKSPSSLEELRQSVEKMNQYFQEYFPKYSLNKRKYCLFSQLSVG